MDLQAVKKAAEAYGPAMTKFLREIVAFPGESAEEEQHVRRIEKEMKATINSHPFFWIFRVNPCITHFL